MADLGAIGMARRIAFSRPLDVWAASNALASGCMARRIAFSRPLDVWAASNALASGCMARATYRAERLATWGAPPYLPIARTGVLSGVCSKPSARIMLYSRQSGQPIAFAFSGADGGYAFAGLSPFDMAGYFAVALDPEATDNALVADLLTPV